MLVVCRRLGLLVAVEMLPGLMRTLGIATMDVALVCVADRERRRKQILS